MIIRTLSMITRINAFTLSKKIKFHSSISNDIVSTKIYDKSDDFDFVIVNFPF